MIEIDVLNVVGGHDEVRIDFDPTDEDGVEKARKIIEALMKGGSVLVIKVDGKEKIVDSFDPATGTYFIKDDGDGAGIDGESGDFETGAGKENSKNAPKSGAGKAKRKGKKAVDATTVKATAVPMRAGG